MSISGRESTMKYDHAAGHRHATEREAVACRSQLEFELRRIEPNLDTPEGAERLIAWLGKHAPSYPSKKPTP
jgi:hypothetical protein